MVHHYGKLCYGIGLDSCSANKISEFVSIITCVRCLEKIVAGIAERWK